MKNTSVVWGMSDSMCQMGHLVKVDIINSSYFYYTPDISSIGNPKRHQSNVSIIKSDTHSYISKHYISNIGIPNINHYVSYIG